MDTALFVWHTGTEQRYGDLPPGPADVVAELTFQRSLARMKADGVRPHLAHPAHEAAARTELPTTLQILRVNKCRLRTWPRMPAGLVEFYAEECDFLVMPNLANYPNLIVLEMEGNRVEVMDEALPPTLARLNLNSNCLRHAHAAVPAPLQNVDLTNNCTIRRAPPGAIMPQWHEYLFNVRRPPAVRYAPIDVPTAPALRNPYTGSQSVHDSGIQASAHRNLAYIARYKSGVPVDPNIITRIQTVLQQMSPIRIFSINNIVTELKHRYNSMYAINGVTSNKIIERLWLRIMDFDEETRKEVITRFCEEVHEATGNCANGFITRMANVLVGYDSNVVMKMNPREIIQGRIPATLTRLRKASNLTEGSEPTAFWISAIRQTWADMNEFDMPSAQRAVWIQSLLDPITETLLQGVDRHSRAISDEQIKQVLEQHQLAEPPLGTVIATLLTDELLAAN